ncbi:hypothetical protein HK103_006356 [Boothiomyces macroporosus]|uniref:AB hydrolase-1 domain-containing protein n=1 Tax=Boothiomyces macroporosus TaxID=261099 RepID=A0AAD5UH06_9FUNG|nr:hypothetical protein HK103_006356 [Boothiomyces macroporosus]
MSMPGFGVDTPHLSSKLEQRLKKAHEVLSRNRTSLLLTLKSGEKLSYAEVGDRNGIPTLWINGPTANRFLIALYDEVCTELGVRLISFDRPGRGASSPLKDPKYWTFASFADYIDEATDLLEIPKFYVVAHSFGTSYALAAYEKLSHKIIGAFRFLATWAPSNLPCMPSSYALQRSLPTSALRTLTSISQSSWLASLTSTSVPCQMGAIGAREKDILNDGYSKRILEKCKLEHDGDSYKAYELDWLLALEVQHKFSFDHRKLKCSVKCWHGMDDSITPLGAAMWMQREMDHFLLYAVEGATHNIHFDGAIVKAVFADICADALARKAKETEEQAQQQPAVEPTNEETRPAATNEQNVPEQASVQPPAPQYPEEQNVWQQ